MMKTRTCSPVLPAFPGLRLIVLVALAVLPALLPRLALAAEAAGTVAAVAGKVTVAGADGAIRTLTKDAPVFSGDIISTGPNSRLRIVFNDNGVIFLRPATRFVIDSYKHTGNVQEDESKFSLVKGGFRAVTGAIGHANKDSVKVATPVATIGIRGTDHEGRFCAGDCLDLTNIGVSAPPDGLYTATNVGRTVVGSQTFAAGQYGFTSPARVTVHLPEPPPILLKDPDLRGGLQLKGDAGGKDKGAAAAGDQKGQGGQPEQKEGDDQKQQQKKGGKPKGKGKAGQAADQGEHEQADQGGGNGGQGGPAGQTAQQGGSAGGGDEAGGTGEGEGVDIPAKPPATHAVQCR